MNLKKKKNYQSTVAIQLLFPGKWSVFQLCQIMCFNALCTYCTTAIQANVEVLTYEQVQHTVGVNTVLNTTYKTTWYSMW